MSTSKLDPHINVLNYSGPAKLNEVSKIIDILKEDLHTGLLNSDQRDKYLETLKVLGRDPTDSDPIFTEQGIKTIASHAFSNLSPTGSRNALRCLANAMLLQLETRQTVVDLGFEENLCNKLKNDNTEDEFLSSRILFLTTYGTTIDIEKLITHYHLADIICHNLSRHANRVASQKHEKNTDSTQEMALIETLKLTFNLTYFCPQQTVKFCPALKDLFLLLTKYPISGTSPLDNPIGPLVNTIMNLDFDNSSTTLFPQLNLNSIIDYCVKLLDKSIQAYGDEELERNAIPLIVILRKINNSAPQETQAYLQKLLLPSIEDRQQILGKGESVSSRLLRQLSNPLTSQLRDSIAELLYELSGSNPNKLITNIGYGFASGFLCNKNLLAPENRPITLDEDDNEDLINKINPVTGQLLEKEENVEISSMSLEEKEREAERLFVLFERLKKNGVISVEDTMRTFQQSGKFENLEDNRESE